MSSYDASTGRRRRKKPPRSVSTHHHHHHSPQWKQSPAASWKHDLVTLRRTKRELPPPPQQRHHLSSTGGGVHQVRALRNDSFLNLNLIIAIISDSYMEAQAELQDRADVQLGKEIKAYLGRVARKANERLTRVPVLGAVFRHAAKVVPAGDAVYGNAVTKVKRAVTKISSNSAIRKPSADPQRGKRTSITRSSFSGSVPLSNEEKAVVMGKITIKDHVGSSRRHMSPTAGGEVRGGDGVGGGVGALPPGLDGGGDAYIRLFEAINQVRREVATVRKFQVAQERRASHIDKQAAEDAAVENAAANVQHV